MNELVVQPPTVSKLLRLGTPSNHGAARAVPGAAVRVSLLHVLHGLRRLPKGHPERGAAQRAPCGWARPEVKDPGLIEHAGNAADTTCAPGDNDAVA